MYVYVRGVWSHLGVAPADGGAVYVRYVCQVLDDVAVAVAADDDADAVVDVYVTGGSCVEDYEPAGAHLLMVFVARILLR